MSKVFADKIEPRDSSMDVTIGTSTNTVTLAGNDLRAGTVKDSGGNTLWVSDGAGTLSSVNAGLQGNLKLLSTQTASSATSVSFTTDIDSTYDVYCFKFIDIGPSNDNRDFMFNGSIDSGSNYNVTKTTTYFEAYHGVDGSSTSFGYGTAYDLAQSTAYQILARDAGGGADECIVGEFWLYGPSSTTYAKHFHSTIQYHHYYSNNQSQQNYVAGYFNTTSAINAIDFKMDSDNFDGIIKMYGLL